MADEAKGKIKEKTGKVTGDRDLEREGKIERGADKIKGTVEDATDKVKDAFKKNR